MSADNFYVIRKHPQGGYAAVMGFASDDREPKARVRDQQYETPELALAAVWDEYAEYGHSIHPECRLEDQS